MTLEEAIDGLYNAFAPHPRRETIDGCPHCVGRHDQDKLARVPLRSLSRDQLSKFAFKALTTWGDPEDYKHFLPRILELATTLDSRMWLGLDLPLITEKIHLAEWTTWPDRERSAIRAFCDALWLTTLSHDPQDSHLQAAESLPCIASLVETVQPFLVAWETNDSLPSVLQLAHFIDANWAEVANRRGLRGPWRGIGSMEQTQQWLLDPARKFALERAFEDHVDEPSASCLAAAIDAWDWMRDAI